MRSALWLTAVLAATLSPSPAFCHDTITTNLTWTKEISRLVYAHCGSCHRPGGSAMSLLTYADARPWAKAIRNQVLERRMPPWNAVKGVGEFRDDPTLSQPELDLFVGWVEGGAPEGDPAYLPRLPDFVTSVSAPPAPANSVRLTHTMVLTHAMLLRGILPEGPLEVTACLPDRAVERLIWLRAFDPQWTRTYFFRHPVSLPRGTQLILTSTSGAAARLITDLAPGL